MSPPTLQTLPRELRQLILGYTFEDAIKKDLRLNSYLRYCGIETQVTVIDWDGKDGKSPAAPSFEVLATNLCLVFPALKEDVVYVLDRFLAKFALLNQIHSLMDLAMRLSKSCSVPNPAGLAGWKKLRWE